MSERTYELRSAHQTGSYAHGFHLAKAENARRHGTPFDNCRHCNSNRPSARAHQSRPGCGMAMQPHSVHHYLLSFHEIIALHAEIARPLSTEAGVGAGQGSFLRGSWLGCCSIAKAFSGTPGYIHANWRGHTSRTLCCRTRCGSHFHSYGFAPGRRNHFCLLALGVPQLVASVASVCSGRM